MKIFKHKSKKRLLVALLLTLVVLATTSVMLTLEKAPSAYATWYADTAWSYRQSITLDHTKVSTSDQTNFPVLIKIITADNAVFTHAKDDGSDILFTDNTHTKLSHEIEFFSKSTKELYAWVKVPTLSASADTELNLYYGNANSTDQQNKTAVWTNGYSAVWHLGETSGNTLDSSVSGITGTVGSGITQGAEGKLGKSYTFAGTGSVNLGNSLSLPAGTSPRTMCAWGKPTSVAAGWKWAMSYGSAAASQAMFVGQNGAYLYGGAYVDDLSSNNFWNVGEWKYGCATYDGTKAALYGQGSQLVAPTSKTWNLTRGATYIGAQVSGGEIWTGGIDEVRISNVARSAGWIATEYANQNSPETFIKSFSAEETVDITPPQNPSSLSAAKDVVGGATTLLASNYYNYPTPYFAWPAAGQSGGASDDISGVAGYYTYFGATCGSSGADPASGRGILSDTGGGLHYSTSASIEVPTIPSNGVYCLRIKTKDVFENVSSTSELFSYKFETTLPAPPSYIATSPVGYSATDAFTFSWPSAADQSSTPSSGLQGYQYKRGDGSGDEWSEIIAATTISDIASYQTGENLFLVRSVDNAGNLSPSTQTTYYYSSNPPTKPTSLSANPELSETNSFSFSWTEPVHTIPISKYGYSINAYPTAENLIWTSGNSTSLSASSYATLQGENKIYIVAKDESGVYSVESSAVAEATFVCNTAAPPAPLNLSVSDSSNRSVSIWALTLKWSAGANQNTGTFAHYSIERSTDGGQSYAEIATTQSLAYIDVSGLANSINYFYRVRSVDNASSKSSPSTVVSKMPTGRFEEPPVIVANPSATAKASSAMISWTVNRLSSSSVRFGKDPNHLDRVQISSQEDTNHLVTLDGLEAGTKYYYQVQALDNYRDYSSESAFSTTYDFSTLLSPGIKDLSVQNITISSAEVIFETSTASTVTMEYGQTISYGTITENNSLTTLHTAKLEKLNPGTGYHLRIRGTDIDGNSLASDDYVFETLPMPAISNLTVQPDYAGPNPGIKINWKTNVPTSSSVEYIPKLGTVSEEESKSALTIDHEILLTGLADSTSYRFYVYGTDQFGNTAKSDQNSLDTPLDSRPPKIIDLNIESQSIGSNSDAKAQIIISWKTDEVATSQVEYGEGSSGTSYTSKTQKDTSLTESHTVIISNLDPSKTYHLKAVSEDKANNPASSEDNAVITKKAQVSPFNIIVSSLAKAFGWLRIFQ